MTYPSNSGQPPTTEELYFAEGRWHWDIWNDCWPYWWVWERDDGSWSYSTLQHGDGHAATLEEARMAVEKQWEE